MKSPLASKLKTWMTGIFMRRTSIRSNSKKLRSDLNSKSLTHCQYSTSCALRSHKCTIQLSSSGILTRSAKKGSVSVNCSFYHNLDLDCYLANLKLLWPYHLYKYSEDHALAYLVCKGYDVETALTTLVVDIEDLISQLKNHDNRMADFFNKSNSKFSYVPISAR